METTLILSIASIVIGILGLCVFAWGKYCEYSWNKDIAKSMDKLDTKKLKRERLLQMFKDFEDVRVQRDASSDLINSIIMIKSSGRTHVANYTKYRYNGSSNRDVDVWHSPTNIWVPYYLMFSTPFEDSCIRYNGEDATSSHNNPSTTQQEVSESTFSRSQYDGSGETTSCDTVRFRSYYDDSYSSSSSSDSYDSGSSSSSSSSDY